MVQAIQEYEDPKMADRGEDREKEMKNEEHVITDHSLEYAREDTVKCFEENEMEAKFKAEVSNIDNSER